MPETVECWRMVTDEPSYQFNLWQDVQDVQGIRCWRCAYQKKAKTILIESCFQKMCTLISKYMCYVLFIITHSCNIQIHPWVPTPNPWMHQTLCVVCKYMIFLCMFLVRTWPLFFGSFLRFFSSPSVPYKIFGALAPGHRRWRWPGRCLGGAWSISPEVFSLPIQNF